jgi:hypothetical protein
MDSLAKAEGELTQRVWMNLHQVEHVFMEGGDFMISSGIVTVDSLNLIRARFECITEQNVNNTLAAYLSAHISSTL